MHPTQMYDQYLSLVAVIRDCGYYEEVKLNLNVEEQKYLEEAMKTILADENDE